MPFTTVTALWTGFTGSPGYTKVKFNGELTSSEATAAANRLRTFFLGFQSLLPNSVGISFSETAQTFDNAGSLIGEVPLSPVPGALLGLSSAAYAGASGAVINWLTSTFVGGRRIRGRTFLVPLAAGYDTAGSLSSATINTISAAANDLAAGVPGLVIFSDRPGATSVATVIGASVPDRAAVLRSRRD